MNEIFKTPAWRFPFRLFAKRRFPRAIREKIRDENLIFISQTPENLFPRRVWTKMND